MSDVIADLMKAQKERLEKHVPYATEDEISHLANISSALIVVFSSHPMMQVAPVLVKETLNVVLASVVGYGLAVEKRVKDAAGLRDTVLNNG